MECVVVALSLLAEGGLNIRALLCIALPHTQHGPSPQCRVLCCTMCGALQTRWCLLSMCSSWSPSAMQPPTPAATSMQHQCFLSRTHLQCPASCAPQTTCGLHWQHRTSIAGLVWASPSPTTGAHLGCIGRCSFAGFWTSARLGCRAPQVAMLSYGKASPGVVECLFWGRVHMITPGLAPS